METRVGDAARDGTETPALSGEAHSEQNLALGALAVPQLGHVAASGVAHSLQNFAPAGFSAPQFEQITDPSCTTGAEGSVAERAPARA
jgi:hypothetical protein